MSKTKKIEGFVYADRFDDYGTIDIHSDPVGIEEEPTERPSLLLIGEGTEHPRVFTVDELRAAWEAGFSLCRAYDHGHFQGEQKERRWEEYKATL